MRVTLHPRRTSAGRRAAVHPRPATPVHAEAPPDAAARREEHRMRTSGGPEDRALYSCHCGCAFKADVSTSVACPSCGGHQTW